jgi:predicted ATPase
MGKTTVLDMFLAQVPRHGTIRIGRGQCIEHYGEGEPYLPVLTALGHLGRAPGGDALVAVLRRYAPMWLVQLPELVDAAEREHLQRQLQGATRARMLRELASTLEVLTAETPGILVLEDLHWSDPSTVALLAYLAQRREPARLLVLGTYRLAEAHLQAHPLRGLLQEMQGHGQGGELCLCALTAAAALPWLIHQRTEGHALFMARLVEHLLQQEVILQQDGQWTLRQGAEPVLTALPEALRPLITRQVERLGPVALRVLEAASVVGDTFPVAAVAAGVRHDLETVEAWCETVVHTSHLLDAEGLTAWPDGTWSSRYRFRHALYRQVLYERLGAGRRLWLHRRTGARLEAGYGAQVGERAAELAVHFLHGRDIARAVYYLSAAAEQALARSAPREALGHCTQGLDLLPAVPDPTERAHRELALLTAMRPALVTTQGYLAPELARVLPRARALCQQVGDGPQSLAVLGGLVTFHLARAEVQTAYAVAEESLHLAGGQPEPTFLVKALYDLGSTCYFRGAFATARQHLA